MMPSFLNAAGFSLTPALVLAALVRANRAKRVPAKAFAPPAQIVAWKHCAILAGTIEFRPDQFPDLEEKLTMGGLPLEPEDALPSTCVEFRDAEDRLIIRIENLAIPVGVAQ